MNETQKVQYLIVDTSAFIRNAGLQIIVTDFAKRTGDYTSLSATDIKVIALTYQLEKEKVGTNHLRTEPTVTQTVDYSIEKSKELYAPLAGFYISQKKVNEDIDEESTGKSGQQKYSEDNSNKKLQTNLENNIKNVDCEEEEKNESCSNDSSNVIESDYDTSHSHVYQHGAEDLSTKFSVLTCEPTEFIVEDKNNIEHNVNDILIPIKKNIDDKEDEYNKYEDNESDNDDDDDDDDDNDDKDNGWITPGNICNVKKELDSDFLEQKPATVACLTMDFAMQNVLKQIGLNVVALDGRLIKQMRTFVLRCYACCKTTSIMTKVFCPYCGHKTLKKVAVTLNEEGKQQIHINFRRQISKKGKRFSLPMPKGGKHACNPILCEDQPIPDQRPSRLARIKNDPLQDDYIAGYSPFIMRDVYSKSAMLGIRPGGSVKYWMRKNPNESRKRRK
ncbi:PREDICTED: RNA-binding protein NOB1 [Habropoda laboriosa]|uniref:RNA-binding protein NOB1 n=1 Tax=Habropoda laboriosa TaxID=597456 RepID=UPI00083D348C|nr:PREDICTED: RNA-binding protein NOB1 [Habropoda laboriosa]